MAQQPMPTVQAYREWLAAQPETATFQVYSDNSMYGDYNPDAIVRPWLASLGMSTEQQDAWLEPDMDYSSEWVERTTDCLPTDDGRFAGPYTRDQVLGALDEAVDAPMG